MLEKINIRSSVPVYVQIENEVRFAIAAGKLKPEEKLPSVRELSERLEINPNTIAKSFRDLEMMGYLYTLRGRGIFVDAKARDKCKRDCRRAVVKRLHEVIAEARAASMPRTEVNEIVKVCQGLDSNPYGELPKEIQALTR